MLYAEGYYSGQDTSISGLTNLWCNMEPRTIFPIPQGDNSKLQWEGNCAGSRKMGP